MDVFAKRDGNAARERQREASSIVMSYSLSECWIHGNSLYYLKSHCISEIVNGNSLSTSQPVKASCPSAQTRKSLKYICTHF